ncbi:putative regulator of Ras-like GTPase activity (Roadblock/LC7/MglB family) [Lipingzhangella halophila]|uniref:Putative regulator of Ras-like GTPase activity (Roadblock/LC7/MglB family) n=1 Tax=Lipingzhangella halophila TaxID=1783352 RepID=A0A7W7RLC1_9ACTN|nr:roadblock/LC7 domain-containing protein [Lipingzhangella halophila]MBB4934056.1 putative regulator of Ras-like GTPase activity (Roadblock/LC7/MglB family) [Lipingzhangella halophila]
MSTSPDQLTWLLDGLVEQVPGVRNAIVLSSDGMLVGASTGMGREDAEHLSAIASSFQSLARGTSRYFDDGGVRQTIVEMGTSFLFVIGAGAGSCLAVLADSGSDMGVIAYEMARLVKRMGEHMSVGARAPVGHSPEG